MLFLWREKKNAEYPNKKTRDKDENQQWIHPHHFDSRPESNSSHIGGRRALSPLRYPYSLKYWKSKIKKILKIENALYPK